jgi:hypothetical protein
MQILANSLQVAAQAVGSKADDACNVSDGLFGWSIVCTALHPCPSGSGRGGARTQCTCSVLLPAMLDC